MKIILTLFMVAASALAAAAEVAGVTLAEVVQLAPGGPQLVLNGAGLRKRVFFDVYAMGLYLPAKKAAAADVLVLAGPKRVAIRMLRDVDAGQFADALADGIRQNHSEADAKVLGSRLTELTAIMSEMKEAKKGMWIVLDWVPGTGTLVQIDGKPAGKVIAGEDFYRGLLRVWLGDDPVQADLRKALLGQPQ